MFSVLLLVKMKYKMGLEEVYCGGTNWTKWQASRSFVFHNNQFPHRLAAPPTANGYRVPCS
jgi:hypothetical protein